jgi:hypothetical protein
LTIIGSSTTTRADKNALARLLERSSYPDRVGIYGSVILDEREPHIVQALGELTMGPSRRRLVTSAGEEHAPTCGTLRISNDSCHISMVYSCLFLMSLLCG